MRTIRHVLPTAALAAAALSVAATSAEAAVPCFKTYPAGWKAQNDGSLMQSLQAGGSAGDQHHGKLTVGGAAYPKLEGSLCAQSERSMSLPTRTVGGFAVSRAVSEAGGKLRWLDTITNPGQGKMVTVDLGLEVLASQVIKTSESGNASANEDDHWTVHQSNALFSTHQWGQDGAVAQPDVVPEDGSAAWEADFGDMDDDATLHYSFFIGAGQTVRLLHAIGTAPSLEAGKTSAKDAAGLFAGYSKAVARDVVNFGDDVDGDGVSKFADECPSVKGSEANGCPKILVPIPPADPEDPEAPAPPADQPTSPEQPAAGSGETAGNGGSGAAPQTGSADRTGPVVTFSGIGSKVLRAKLTRRAGTKATVACSEECRITAKLVVKPRGRKAPKTVQRFGQDALSAKPRELKLRVSSAKLRGLAKQRVTLVVEAVDRAGNRTTVERGIGLR